MEEENWKDKLSTEVEKYINKILEEGISSSNLMNLGQFVDIQKDLENIKYWKEKEDMYNRRYEDSYGRRGVPGTGRGRRYRGEDMLEEMKEHYGNYMESGRSRYSGESDEAFDYMLESAKDFFMHLFDESKNQEQEEKIRRTAKEISEMG